jgi:hypothetical protein
MKISATWDQNGNRAETISPPQGLPAMGVRKRRRRGEIAMRTERRLFSYKRSVNAVFVLSVRFFKGGHVVFEFVEPVFHFPFGRAAAHSFDLPGLVE